MYLGSFYYKFLPLIKSFDILFAYPKDIEMIRTVLKTFSSNTDVLNFARI